MFDIDQLKYTARRAGLNTLETYQNRPRFAGIFPYQNTLASYTFAEFLFCMAEDLLDDVSVYDGFGYSDIEYNMDEEEARDMDRACLSTDTCKYIMSQMAQIINGEYVPCEPTLLHVEILTNGVRAADKIKDYLSMFSDKVRDVRSDNESAIHMTLVVRKEQPTG